ncbi:MAG TPA: DNA polymerase IV [Gemmatimonadales bacterium]|nr:DNA polymerase IV [Gemmatimonadales bacterium]
MHLDLDAFFVEVCRREDPALRDVELLVVGGRRTSRGVVQSASYGARAFGVRSGMPIAEAVRRCPRATFVQGTFASYRAASRAVQAVLTQHAPVVVMVGLDEGYLDYSGTDLLHPVSLLGAATALRRAVHEATQLDCSIGIGPNRTIAKIASDYAKPRGICEVRAGWERRFLAGLPLKALPGIGPKTAERLAALGLTDVIQVQETPEEELVRLLGRDAAVALARRASGAGGTSVRPRTRARSVSRETTFSRDLSDSEALDRVLVLLTARIGAQLRDEQLVAGAIVLKLRFADFRTITRRLTLPEASADDLIIRETARALLQAARTEPRARGAPIRLLGVGTVNLLEAPLGDLFSGAAPPGRTEVTSALDAVRAKYGFDALRPGRLVRRPPRARPDD